MSMHKIPLTPQEEAGLRAHGLDIGTPSQLSDVFRHGVAWANRPEGFALGATKPLYVLVSDGGDGSYYPRFTFDTDWVLAREQAADDGELDPGSTGLDGDGFHYTVLMVPASCTLESLGISYDLANAG